MPPKTLQNISGFRGIVISKRGKFFGVQSGDGLDQLPVAKKKRPRSDTGTNKHQLPVGISRRSTVRNKRIMAPIFKEGDAIAVSWSQTALNGSPPTHRRCRKRAVARARKTQTDHNRGYPKLTWLANNRISHNFDLEFRNNFVQ